MRLFLLSGALSCRSISPRDGTMDPEQLMVSLGRGEANCEWAREAHAWDRRSWSACQPHIGRLYTCLSVKAELINLYFKLMKPCSYSFVDIGSNRARRDRNSDEFDSDRRKLFYLTTREFGLFSSSEACFKHYKCIL
jgi:hypothetical protein